jgi:hypothetical protein
MAGLNLRMMGGVSAVPGPGYSSDMSSATSAAFGPGYTQAGLPGAAETFKPNDPFGIAFWVGVASLVGLLVIRHSLPQ